MRSVVFIAWLFCASGAALLGGGIELYEYIEWRFRSQAAHMELADSSKKQKFPASGYDVYLVNVKYVSSAGELAVPQKRLIGDRARTLASGESIPVTYLTHDPHRVLYSTDQLPNPWGWLVAGVALMATFIYALKLKRRESE